MHIAHETLQSEMALHPNKMFKETSSDICACKKKNKDKVQHAGGTINQSDAHIDYDQ